MKRPRNFSRWHDAPLPDGGEILLAAVADSAEDTELAGFEAAGGDGDYVVSGEVGCLVGWGVPAGAGVPVLAAPVFDGGGPAFDLGPGFELAARSA